MQTRVNMHRDREFRNNFKFHPQFCSAGVDLKLPCVWHIHLSHQFLCHQEDKCLLIQQGKASVGAKHEETMYTVCVTRGLRSFVPEDDSKWKN